MESRSKRVRQRVTDAGKEFQALTRGYRTKYLAELLGVSSEMIGRYRYQGAPPDRLQRLLDHLAERHQAVVR